MNTTKIIKLYCKKYGFLNNKLQDTKKYGHNINQNMSLMKKKICMFITYEFINKNKNRGNKLTKYFN